MLETGGSARLFENRLNTGYEVLETAGVDWILWRMENGDLRLETEGWRLETVGWTNWRTWYCVLATDVGSPTQKYVYIIEGQSFGE